MLKPLFVALLLVTTLSTQTIKNTESNHQPKKVSILPTLTQPVYAAKEEMKPIVTTPPPKPVVAPVATSDDKAFIYQKESGNRPDAINASSGACGLGQALPCSKMGCSLSDYACQDAWFTNYMLNRYGSWANARAFWESHRWW